MMFYFYIPEEICFAVFVAFPCTWYTCWPASKQANTHTRIRKVTKNTKEKHKWKRAKFNHVQEKATKTAKQIPSGI
jgi:apolipoprotein N-acyltransferase